MIYTGTSGQTADAGFAPAAAIGNDTLETSSFTAACNQAPYDVSNAGAQTVTAPAVPATGNCIIVIRNKGAGTWTFTGSSNVYDLESATPGTLVSSATITTNQSRGITADGTNFWMSASAPTSVLTGITAPANGGTGVANTATLTLGSSNQNWATLGTGIVKNTTTTGALTDAAAADVYGLWSGTCNSSSYLRGDGACATPSGSGTVNSGTASHLAYYASSTTAVSDMGADFTFATHTLSTASTAIFDMSPATGTAAFKVPSTTTNTATAAGVIDYDTTNSNYHAYSGADSLIGVVPTASIPTTGHVIDASVVSSKFLLHDSGLATANLVTASSPGLGIAHFAGSTQALTSSLIVAADITSATITGTQIAGTTVAGSNMVNATVTATQLAAQYSKGSCTEAWGGSGTSHAMTSGDDAVTNNACYNDSGVTRTITAVKCRSDNAANTTVLTPTFGAAGTGTAILTGTVTCGNSYAYSATGTVNNASWTTGTGIDPGMSTVGNSTSIAMIVEYTY